MPSARGHCHDYPHPVAKQRGAGIPPTPFHGRRQLVWDAAYQSVATAAKHHNLPCRNEQEAYDAAAHLERIQQGRAMHHWLRLQAADVFRTPAAHYGENGAWQWNPDEYIESLGDIRKIVAWLSPTETAAKIASKF